MFVSNANWFYNQSYYGRSKFHVNVRNYKYPHFPKNRPHPSVNKTFMISIMKMKQLVLTTIKTSVPYPEINKIKST